MNLSDRQLTNRLLSVCMLLYVPTYSSSVAADEIFFDHGAILSGQTIEDKSSPQSTVVQLGEGFEIGVPPSKLKVMRPTPMPEKTESAEQFYLKNAKAIPDTIEGHGKIRDWANSNRMLDIAAAHNQRLVELNTDDRAAWRALRYMETSNGWIPQERYMLSKGMVRDGTTWRVPQAVEIERAAKDRKKSEFEIKRKIDVNLRDLKANNSRTQTARQFFAELNDANALSPLVEAYKEASDNVELRDFLLDAISRLDSKGKLPAIVDLCVNEPDARLRNRCIDILRATRSDGVLIKLQSYLVNKDPHNDSNEKINRAAEILSYVGDDRAIPRLIDVLTTEHVMTVGPPTSNNYGITNGNAGISQGAKKVKQQFQNQDVLTALTAITGESLSYNKDDWRNWYAAHYAHTGLQLRRDP